MTPLSSLKVVEARGMYSTLMYEVRPSTNGWWHLYRLVFADREKEPNMLVRFSRPAAWSMEPEFKLGTQWCCLRPWTSDSLMVRDATPLDWVPQNPEGRYSQALTLIPSLKSVLNYREKHLDLHR